MLNSVKLIFFNIISSVKFICIVYYIISLKNQKNAWKKENNKK